jgi:hypothetical protein
VTAPSPSSALDSGTPASERIEARLAILKSEFEAGQAELQKVMTQQNSLHETLLRISGAIQVLEELLAEMRMTIDVDSHAPAAQTNGGGV